MDEDLFIEQEIVAFSELCGENGDLLLGGFLEALLKNGETRQDFRDFSREEIQEMLVAMLRMIEMFEDTGE